MGPRGSLTCWLGLIEPDSPIHERNRPECYAHDPFKALNLESLKMPEDWKWPLFSRRVKDVGKLRRGCSRGHSGNFHGFLHCWGIFCVFFSRFTICLISEKTKKRIRKLILKASYFLLVFQILKAFPFSFLLNYAAILQACTKNLQKLPRTSSQKLLR